MYTHMAGGMSDATRVAASLRALDGGAPAAPAGSGAGSSFPNQPCSSPALAINQFMVGIQMGRCREAVTQRPLGTRLEAAPAITGSIPACCLPPLLPRGTKAAPLGAASSSAAASSLAAVKHQSWEQPAPKFLLESEPVPASPRPSLPHKSGRDPTQRVLMANTRSSLPLPPQSFTHGSPGARPSSCLAWWGERLQ